MQIAETSPLRDLTVREFRQLLREEFDGRLMPPATTAGCTTDPKRLVFGLRGVQDLFHCSHRQAQYYKDNVIREAVSQNGRKIVVDADLALKLFNERRKK